MMCLKDGETMVKLPQKALRGFGPGLAQYQCPKCHKIVTAPPPKHKTAPEAR